METLKFICLTVGRLITQVWSLPKNISSAVGEKRRQALADEYEAERLDRLRNPSNYRGR